jgi:hypothetical protein
MKDVRMAKFSKTKKRKRSVIIQDNSFDNIFDQISTSKNLNQGMDISYYIQQLLPQKKRRRSM